jgi:hypothetical protein
LRIDGVGEQAHWGLDEPPIAEIERTITETAAGTGLKVLLTELDIDVLPRDPEMWGTDLSKKMKIRAATNIYPDGLPEEQQRLLARRYADIFALVMRHRDKISRVTLWGVTDGQSWLHDFPIPGRVNYPLLWDRQGQPKRAFDADERGQFDLAKAQAHFADGRGLGQVGRPSDAGGGLTARQMGDPTNDIQRFFRENTRLGPCCRSTPARSGA